MPDNKDATTQAGEETAAGPALPREVAWLVKEGYSPIRAWREHVGVTQEELGRRLEVSAAAVAQMEARSARPRAATLKKIAAVLGLDWELLRAK
jgi:ribosome-binding protein aMBF1 (putative translation factor)